MARPALFPLAGGYVPNACTTCFWSSDSGGIVISWILQFTLGARLGGPPTGVIVKCDLRTNVASHPYDFSPSDALTTTRPITLCLGPTRSWSPSTPNAVCNWWCTFSVSGRWLDSLPAPHGSPYSRLCTSGRGAEVSMRERTARQTRSHTERVLRALEFNHHVRPLADASPKRVLGRWLPPHHIDPGLDLVPTKIHRHRVLRCNVAAANGREDTNETARMKLQQGY